MQYDTPDIILPVVSDDESGYARLVMPYLAAGTENAGKRNEDGSPEAPAAHPDRNNR